MKNFLLCLLALMTSIASAKNSKLILLVSSILLTVTNIYANEKVHLHFDNTGYFLGETIWFSAYVNDTETNLPTEKSKVLYVELLAPEGDVLDTRVYKLYHGFCAGNIPLPSGYFSGYFEVRAYTRYMLNWGYDNYFSRVFPVYDAVKNGDYSFRSMLKRERITDRESENEWRNVNGFAASGRKNSYLSPLPAIKTDMTEVKRTSSSTIVPLKLTMTGKDDDLKPNQKITLTFHGKPNESFSLSVTDDETEPQTGYDKSIVEDLADKPDMDSENLQSLNLQNADATFVKPEEGLTIRGRMVTKKTYYRSQSKMVAVPNEKLNLTMTTPTAKYNALYKTDDKGYFSIPVNDFHGKAMAFLHYVGDWNKNVAIRIDRWFSPPPRKYTAEEINQIERNVSRMTDVKKDSLSGHLLRNVTIDGKKRTHTYREYVHSIQKFFLPEEVEWMVDNENYEPDSPICGYYRVLSLVAGIFEHHHFAADAIRMVMLPGEYPGDSVVPKYKWIYDGGIRPFFHSKYAIIRTDWPVREAYNYNVLPTSRQPKNTVSIGSESFKETGLSGDTPLSKYPYYVIFFEPFSKNEEDSRLNRFNLTDNTRYTTVHGFTEAETFNTQRNENNNLRDDTRRTLYWNPEVTTNENGDATIVFYNNSTCRKLSISAEGITKDGTSILYKE